MPNTHRHRPCAVWRANGLDSGSKQRLVVSIPARNAQPTPECSFVPSSPYLSSSPKGQDALPLPPKRPAGHFVTASDTASTADRTARQARREDVAREDSWPAFRYCFAETGRLIHRSAHHESRVLRPDTRFGGCRGGRELTLEHADDARSLPQLSRPVVKGDNRGGGVARTRWLPRTRYALRRLRLRAFSDSLDSWSSVLVSLLHSGHRVDPTRVSRPRHRIQRTAPATTAPHLRRLLPSITDASRARQGPA